MDDCEMTQWMYNELKLINKAICAAANNIAHGDSIATAYNVGLASGSLVHVINRLEKHYEKRGFLK